MSTVILSAWLNKEYVFSVVLLRRNISSRNKSTTAAEYFCSMCRMWKLTLTDPHDDEMS